MGDEQSLTPPRTPDELHAWLRRVVEVDVARTALVDGHDAPFAYVADSFFEGRAFDDDQHPRHTFGPTDRVVWANRGGGKTFLGAVATMLDLVFKPGIEVRVLGGSLEQSRRMHEHLRALFERDALRPLVDGRTTQSRVRLTNASRAEVLAQSHASVRGTRVQKVRCDEVELFDPDLWSAAQLTTRSMRLPGPWGQWVRGSVDALSTMHRPHGLMWRIAGQCQHQSDSEPAGRRLFRWGVIDALERCHPLRPCNRCPLEAECAGLAKSGEGHISIDDAIGMKRRVGTSTWEAEMLCRRPDRTHAVLPEFDPARHVYADPSAPVGAQTERRATLIAGMDFGFRSPSVVLFAQLTDAILRIVDELVVTETTVARIAERIRAHPLGPPAWLGVDPAGRQRSEQTGVSSISVLRDAGLSVRWRRSGVQEGLGLIRARLDPASRAPDTNDPTHDLCEPAGARLMVHARCTTLIESMATYHYPEKRPDSLDPVKDGPDHAVDALRYLLINLERPRKAGRGRYC